GLAMFASSNQFIPRYDTNGSPFVFFACFAELGIFARNIELNVRFRAKTPSSAKHAKKTNGEPFVS
ncbi:MAG TPA: hypothetical protein VLG74_14680, partial [Blastocatellia bacterium]|nr:hypothetical protein [Blastocatellia bacterium]